MSCFGRLKLLPTSRGFATVVKFGTNYFLLKIKILAKREREFTTKFAIARNGCCSTYFFFQLILQQQLQQLCQLLPLQCHIIVVEIKFHNSIFGLKCFDPC